MKFLRKIFGLKSEAEKIQSQADWENMKLCLKDKVAGLTQPAVHFVKTGNKTNSKFGGKPLVDKHDFEWPVSNGKSLAFLAQIDLSEVAAQLRYEWLDDTGVILFFYDVEEMPWGFDPKDRGKWKVIYQQGSTIEIEYPKDLKTELIIEEQYIEARKINRLPSFEDRSIQALNLSDEETDLFIEIGEHFKELNFYQDQPAHQVGGFPRPVQGDEMQFEAQQASNGIYMGDSKAYQSATENDFVSAKNKWKLLFQIDSDEDLELMWGDLGTLYFWVEQDRSKLNDFDNTWLTLQCS